MNNYDWLQNAHCFNCEAEEPSKQTPLSKGMAKKSIEETGLVRCNKHLEEWRKDYGKN